MVIPIIEWKYEIFGLAILFVNFEEKPQKEVLKFSSIYMFISF
jgi:hypothetical protein